MTTSAPVRTTTDGGEVDVTPWDTATRCFRAWKDGDRAALDEFVRRVSPVLWHVVRSYGLDQSSAEDVVQTTWLTLMRKSEQVRDEQAVLRWLTITARREAWRVSQLQGRTSPTEDTVIETALPTARSPESQVLESESQRRLWQHVGQLDERCQHLLRVVAFQDRPDYASLARHFGMPVGSIGPTRSRCLAKLRTMMTSDEGSRR